MKVRKISISSLLFLIMTLLLLIGDIGMGTFIFHRTKNMLQDQINQRATETADSIAHIVDANAMVALQNGDHTSSDYVKMFDDLTIFLENTEAEYVYTLRKNSSDEFECVVDSDPESVTLVGEIYDTTPAMDTAYTTGETTVSEPYTDEWGNHISACSPIFLGDEIVGLAVIDLSVDMVNIQSRNLATVIILIFIIVFFIVMVALSVISLHLKRSFKLLNNKISDLTDGSGDLTKTINIKSGDEFEVIAENVNTFTKEIRGLVSSISNTSKGILKGGERLNSTVEDNSESIREMNQNLTNLSATMEECSATSQVASDTLTATRQNIESFASQLLEIEDMTDKEHEMALNASNVASTHRNEADETISRLKAGIQKASEDAKAIEEVTNITNQINNIAAQTRMLSLNAQIEAARAGEQGKGFTVVATNVQELSLQIDESVKDITEINERALNAVHSLMEQTAEMTAFMEKNVTEDYKIFAELGANYGKSTHTIKNSMNKLGNESREILESISTIDSSIIDISSAITESAAQVTDVAQASVNISDSMIGLSEVSAENSRESKSLELNIKKYRF